MMSRHTVFASAVAAARGVLLKSEVVQTLHTTVFSALRASWYACQVQQGCHETDRDMNHVLGKQKAEKRLLLLEKAQEMIGSKSVTGGKEKPSCTTVERPTLSLRRRSVWPTPFALWQQSLRECHQPNTCTS